MSHLKVESEDDMLCDAAKAPEFVDSAEKYLAVPAPGCTVCTVSIER